MNRAQQLLALCEAEKPKSPDYKVVIEVQDIDNTWVEYSLIIDDAKSTAEAKRKALKWATETLNLSFAKKRVKYVLEPGEWTSI